jgi:WD40 repeat protein
MGFDPFKEERLATYSEDGTVKLWDIRMFVEPVYDIISYNFDLSFVY